MDWSLALISQGIESTVVCDPEGWQLLVSPADLNRATTTIEQYVRENRGWNWRHRLAWPEATFHWGALVWCIVVAFFHWWSTSGGEDLRRVGMMDGSAAARGEWWRLFTAISLHADAAHLAANLTSGFLILGLAMARWGAAPALLAAWLAGALGNAAGLLFSAQPYPSLGASGMVMGGLGLLAVQSFRHWRTHPAATKRVISGLAGGFLLFVLLGLDPSSDVLAHAGGFVGGTILGIGMCCVPVRKFHSAAVDVIASVTLVIGVIATWALALR